MSLNELAKQIHDNAVRHGWWDGERKLPEACMMIVTEVAEAVDEYRNRRPDVYGTDHNGTAYDYEESEAISVEDFFADGLKPEGVSAELCDVLIRTLDLLAALGQDIDGLMKAKMEFNKRRPYRHGDKRC